MPEEGRKPGGVEVFVDRLADALAGRGHDVEVLAYSRAPETARYRTRRLRPLVTQRSRVVRQYVSPWLMNMRSLDGFDVAHFHGDDWFYFRRRLPVVRTFHGSALLEARTASSWKRRLDKALVFPLELLAAGLATASYGVGPDSEAIYGTEGMLNLGVELSEPVAPGDSNPVILFIGTWAGRKRGAFLSEIFHNKVLPVVPEAELWMVSDHCEADPSVRWIQTPSDEELRSLMAKARCFCLPSSYEGFGIPYLEAMAQGVPVVATSNPGSRLLLGGNAGILVEDDELGSRLIEVLTDSALRSRLSKCGRARAEEYSWERAVERHEAAYQEAIDRWKSATVT